MSSNPQTPNPSIQRYSDEIDLGDLMLRIWATRVYVVKAVLAVLALFTLYIGVSYMLSEKTVRYSQVFDLAFEGLRKGEFPNGSAFMLSDITSPTVLNRVYRQNNLEAHGLKIDDFRRGVTIQPYAPDYALIRSKYEARLTDKKLTPTDIAELQKQMANELEAAQSGSLIITLILPEQRSLTSDLAQKILLDIPSSWADRAINEQGVLKPNVPVYSERIFDKKRFENLDYLLGMDLILNSIKLVRSNITSLKGQPNASTLVDDESGFTLVDLDKAIQDVADYDIRQIIDPIKELGISRNPEVVKLYYTRRLADLEQEQKLWKDRAEVIRRVLAGYSSDKGSSPTAVSGNQNNMVPQLGDAFLDRLLEVSRQGSDLEFRQKLTQEVLKYENQSIDLEQQIAEIKRVLATMSNGQGTDQKLRDVYVKTVEEQLPSVLDNLREYTRVMGRMYEKQGKQNAGNISQLVEAQGGTFRASGTAFIEIGSFKLLLAVLMLAVMSSLMFGLLRNQKYS
ncbi:MAG TPA: hypothetical protein PK873_09695 [Pseudomonas sp.]|uniref:hypothetical protein n=1 Tax=Pseudomonas sp. TaxID=306 RepID=UPI002C9A0595|nr:hypothetical protein [Pseudomonas sp.]HRL93825.1 hypothetical protein [Pseudomonas sp.]